jgi:4'-phosphopantetheinyl transferase
LAVAFPQKIAAQQIHVWAWLLDSSAGFNGQEKSHTGLLDAKELERFHRFHFESDQARFAIAHANVRRVLGAYLDREPECILFRANPFGKPELVAVAQTRPLHFNLSHSRNICFACSLDRYRAWHRY